MKAYFKCFISVGAMMLAVAAVQPCAAAGPTVVVSSPNVVVSPPAMMTPVPDNYVWDGSEYVGVVGSQYYYLGPGNVWVVMAPGRLHRFQAWERGHPDWRAHATHNVRYRTMGHETRPKPMRANPPSNPNQLPERNVNPGQYGPP
jgi:hypothetical protein